MKITKRQLRKIIKEEKSRLLNERNEDSAQEFEDIMRQIGELVQEAFEIAGKPAAARQYWYNGILARVDPGQHGMADFSYAMVDTLSELSGGGDEEMMEMGYNDGADGKPPAHPDNEYYMTNYEDAIARSGNP